MIFGELSMLSLYLGIANSGSYLASAACRQEHSQRAGSRMRGLNGGRATGSAVKRRRKFVAAARLELATSRL